MLKGDNNSSRALDTARGTGRTQIVQLLEHAHRRRRALQARLGVVDAGRTDERATTHRFPGLLRLASSIRVRWIFAASAATLVVAAAWWLGAQNAAKDTVERLAALETLVGRHTRELAEMQTRILAATERTDNLDELSIRVQTLARSIQALGDKLASDSQKSADIAAAEVTVAAAGAAGTMRAADSSDVPGATQEGSPSAVEAEDSAALDHEVAGTESELVPARAMAPSARRYQSSVAATTRASSAREPEATAAAPWVINLISGKDPTAIDRFVAKAESRGIAVVKRQVSVKGKTYWRVQIGGFASADEARSRAGPVKETLGLKSVWISRQ